MWHLTELREFPAVNLNFPFAARFPIRLSQVATFWSHYMEVFGPCSAEAVFWLRPASIPPHRRNQKLARAPMTGNYATVAKTSNPAEAADECDNPFNEPAGGSDESGIPS